MAGTMFENISYLTNRHSIDIGMVENIFGFAIYNYYHILKNGNPEWDAIALERNTLGETYREIEHFAESYESKRSEINKSKEPKDRQAELIQVHRAKMTDEYLALELGLPK